MGTTNRYRPKSPSLPCLRGYKPKRYSKKFESMAKQLSIDNVSKKKSKITYTMSDWELSDLLKRKSDRPSE